MAGFTKVDNALLEAILASRLTKRQLKALLLVLRFSAGFQKTYAVLRQKDFEFAGISRYCVGAELEKLCSLRVLGWDPNRHLVWVNPNLRHWGTDRGVDDRRTFFRIAAKNSSKWQHASFQNSNTSVAKTATSSAGLKDRKRNLKRQKDHIFSSILEEYFLKIAPVSSEEAFILKELLARHGAPAVRAAIARMAASGERSFSVFLKTLDGAAPRTRTGCMSTLGLSLRRYDKFFPAP